MINYMIMIVRHVVRLLIKVSCACVNHSDWAESRSMYNREGENIERRYSKCCVDHVYPVYRMHVHMVM